MEGCLICGKFPVEMHHVFFGRNRKNSDRDGYIVPLCPEHHRGKAGAHQNRELDLELKKMFQKEFEEGSTRERFIQRYGRSYL